MAGLDGSRDASGHLVGNRNVADVVEQTPLAEQSNRRNEFDTDSVNLQINGWLKSLGLDFNPFFALNAAVDPHLSEYLIGNDVFKAIWGNWNSFVFEPAGGGKTALRVQTAQACWETQDINRPFPIPYNPPFLKWETIKPSLDDHLAEIAIAAAEQLFLGLSHRPHWFLEMNRTAQERIGELLARILSVDWLAYHLDELAETNPLQALKLELDPTFNAPDPPGSAALDQFCTSLRSTLEGSIPASGQPELLWASLAELLVQQLKFPAIYLLLDGLDTTYETASDPHTAIAALTPLFALIPTWSTQLKIFVKGFLPAETKAEFHRQAAIFAIHPRIASINWDQGKLAELVRRRAFVASKGQFNSLDAIVTPDLRDFETLLVEEIVALRPREILTLINEIFAAHTRNNGQTGKIDETDWQEGLLVYKRDAFALS
ncbi:MAG: hypothetical protein H6633_21530 [Anaerolineales bacterium]|nr:hypothetical protein [Anaerolineales bacterium]